MKLGKIALSFILAVILCPSVLWACDCAYQTPQAHLDQADLVFIGKVLEVRSSWGQMEVKFQTIEFQRAGEDDQEEKILVYTGENEAECGYTFEKDGVYQVFANKESDRFMTNLCSGNQRLRKFEQ